MIARPDLTHTQARALAAPLALDRANRPTTADEWLDALDAAERRPRPIKWAAAIAGAGLVGALGVWWITAGGGGAAQPSAPTGRLGWSVGCLVDHRRRRRRGAAVRTDDRRAPLLDLGSRGGHRSGGGPAAGIRGPASLGARLPGSQRRTGAEHDRRALRHPHRRPGHAHRPSRHQSLRHGGPMGRRRGGDVGRPAAGGSGQGGRHAPAAEQRRSDGPARQPAHPGCEHRLRGLCRAGGRRAGRMGSGVAEGAPRRERLPRGRDAVPAGGI